MGTQQGLCTVGHSASTGGGKCNFVTLFPCSNLTPASANPGRVGLRRLGHRPRRLIHGSVVPRVHRESTHSHAHTHISHTHNGLQQSDWRWGSTKGGTSSVGPLRRCAHPVDRRTGTLLRPCRCSNDPFSHRSCIAACCGTRRALCRNVSFVSLHGTGSADGEDGSCN